MQSYPLHTHNIVLFLISSWKQTLGVHRVVSVEDRTWENNYLAFSSLRFDTPYLSLPPLGIATMIPCTWGLSCSPKVLSTLRMLTRYASSSGPFMGWFKHLGVGTFTLMRWSKHLGLHRLMEKPVFTRSEWELCSISHIICRWHTFDGKWYRILGQH